MKLLFALLFLVFSTGILFAQTSVLFIGNSYTYVNDLPATFNSLSTSLNKAVVTSSKTNGGYSFQNQWNDPATYTAIHQQAWDVVVLQAQSQEPSFPTDQVNSGTLPFAISLSDSIYVSNNCTNVMYYMTWGRENGDPQWDSINTFDKMNARLYNAYMRFADSTDAMVSPVAVAWKSIRDNYPAIQLYVGDGSHPTEAGTYLIACVFYASIFQETPVGATYIGGLDQATADVLQQAAAAAVIGSEEIYHLHDVSYRTSATFNWNVDVSGLLSVISTSTKADSYYWDFGDGTTSTLENPTHQYVASGTYQVQLIATSACNSDTAITSVTVSTVGIDEKGGIDFEIYPNPATDLIEIQSNYFGIATIYDVKGILVKSINTTNQTSTINIGNLESGIYLIQIGNTSKRFVKD